MQEKKGHLIDEYCEYCDKQLSTWDARLMKTLHFDFNICEDCIAEEYGMDKDYFRGTMERRFGMHPCEGL